MTPGGVEMLRVSISAPLPSVVRLRKVAGCSVQVTRLVAVSTDGMIWLPAARGMVIVIAGPVKS